MTRTSAMPRRLSASSFGGFVAAGFNWRTVRGLRPLDITQDYWPNRDLVASGQGSYIDAPALDDGGQAGRDVVEHRLTVAKPDPRMDGRNPRDGGQPHAAL